MALRSRRSGTPSDGREPRGSHLLRQGVVRGALVANAYRPVRNNLALTVPSFFASWLVSEATPGLIGLWGARTVHSLRRRSQDGRALGPGDLVGLGLTAAATVGAVGLVRQGRRSSEEYTAALSTLVPADELADAPRALRAGALLPLLNGNRRRRRTRNIVFNPAEPGQPKRANLKLDVYLPLDDVEPGQKRPAVLQIHGGAWVLGSKDEQGIPLLNHLASCGWVGFNADYRLSPRAKFPDHLVDCKRALAWIREHADEYDVDPNFIVVTGGSAGGHLCALVALTQDDPAFQPGFEDADTSVQAAVPFYGVYDLTDREHHNGPQFVDLLTRLVMGVSMDEAPESWAAYSPLDRITDEAPPTFVIHGDKDVLVPVEGARRFVADLRAASNRPVVYAELHGAQHAFEVFPSFRTINTVEAVERFLHHVHAEYLASEAPPEAVEPTADDDAATPGGPSDNVDTADPVAAG